MKPPEPPKPPESHEVVIDWKMELFPFLKFFMLVILLVLVVPVVIGAIMDIYKTFGIAFLLVSFPLNIVFFVRLMGGKLDARLVVISFILKGEKKGMRAIPKNYLSSYVVKGWYLANGCIKTYGKNGESFVRDTEYVKNEGIEYGMKEEDQ